MACALDTIKGFVDNDHDLIEFSDPAILYTLHFKALKKISLNPGPFPHLCTCVDINVPIMFPLS